MKKPALILPKDASPAQIRFNGSVKEALETIMGRRGAKIEPLPADAGLTDIVAKLNELIEVLQ